MKNFVVFLLLTLFFSACSDKNKPQNDKKTSDMVEKIQIITMESYFMEEPELS